MLVYSLKDEIELNKVVKRIKAYFGGSSILHASLPPFFLIPHSFSWGSFLVLIWRTGAAALAAFVAFFLSKGEKYYACRRIMRYMHYVHSV